ncbi:MAG TPA: DUF1552 domain-containing protein [Vicinamibacterales bacterium]|nr:DUF1552 domain-containing protein [Vicinamibacterales bacterium]
MSFISKKHIPRRTFIRGAGVTLALPLLDSMVPAFTALAQSAAAPRLRLGFCFMPHGAVMANWTPTAEGALELSPILAPLEPYKKVVVVLSNLAHAMAGPQGPGDNGGDHTRCPAVFLNGVHPKRTDGADIRAGVTIDQIAAEKIGQDTLLPSLELAIEDYSGLVGSCDVGFSCTYMNTISWRTPTAPMPMEINPRVVFDRMFGDGATAEERRRRIDTQRSILDAVTDQVRRLQGGLGSSDRNRVAEYLDTVREIERRIALSEKQASQNLDVPVSPRGIPDDFVEHTKLMFDLMTIAYQANITRITTFMMAREVSYRTFPMLGISEAFHPASHHQNSPERLAQLTRIQAFHVGLWSYWLEKLRSTPDGDGTLLDHSLILYGGAMSNSNVHNHAPLPIVVAGGANGSMKGGRHLKYADNTPMANLLLTILEKAGVHQDSVGDSTGLLTEV